MLAHSGGKFEQAGKAQPNAWSGACEAFDCIGRRYQIERQLRERQADAHAVLVKAPGSPPSCTAFKASKRHFHLVSLFRTEEPAVNQ